MRPHLQAQTISKVEFDIYKAIEGLTLWGDLNYSYEEYENLRECIKTAMRTRMLSITKFAEKYPFSITTFMVLMARYKYNTNFWSLMGEELDTAINPNQQSDLGNCAKKTFTRYGFDISDCADDHWTNLAPIFYEAGIPPESCFDDLFYILSYDSHTVFDSQLLIEDLLESRSYQIRKPMAKFLKRFKDDRAIEFVVDIHDAMLCVDQNKSEAAPYASNYINWKERQLSKEAVSTRKKQEYQAKPYLSFDSAGKGLCIVLPRVILRDEWIDTVNWRVTDERDIEVKKTLSVSGDEGSRFVPSFTIPVSPSHNYIITLIDADMFEDADIFSWTISGIPVNSIAYFNSAGRMISANYLVYPYATMIIDQRVEITETCHVSATDRDYPTNRPGYRIVEIVPEGPCSSVSYSISGTVFTLKTKPQINVGFIGNTLFSLPSEECSLFTDIPKMIITIDKEFDVTDLEIRVNGKSKSIDAAFEDGVAILQLKSMCHGTFSQYGTYSIKLYQNDHFLKQAEFSYVPVIRSDYSAKLCWRDAQNKAEKVYHFAKIPDFDMDFENCTVISDEDNYTVFCPPSTGIIHISISTSGEDGHFSKQISLPIRPIDFSIKDSNGSDVDQTLTGLLKLGLEDISSNEYWLYLETFGEFRKGVYDVLLRTANGVEQKAHISLAQNGYANLNLSVFHDTMSNCLLPARLEICCNSANEDTVSILLINDKASMSFRPKYHPSAKILISNKDDGKNLTLKKFGSSHFEISLPYSSAILKEDKNIIVYPCSEPLTNGFYVVECSKNETIFEFEDIETVVPSNGSNTLYVTSHKIGSPVTCFSEWLDEFIQIILRAGRKHDLSEFPEYAAIPSLKLIKEKRIRSDDYEKLIALAYFAVDKKCLNLKKESIIKGMQDISLFILNNTARKDILITLAKLKCPQSVFDICLESYNLFLFEKDTADASILADRIESSSLELALLLRMGKEDTIRNTIWRDKYMDLIGREALRSLITVPNEVDREIINTEIKKFVKEQPCCKVQIELTKDISGDMQPIVDMIVYPKASTHAPYLDVSRKSDAGIYFGHIKYIDQYISWYKANHDHFGNMKPATEGKMKLSVEEYAEKIKYGVQTIKKDPDVANIALPFHQAVKARYTGDPAANPKIPNPHRFFYLQAMAALIVMLPQQHRKPSWNVSAAEQFLTYALSVAPKISRRDILMAATFVYLVRKEKLLCQ